MSITLLDMIRKPTTPIMTPVHPSHMPGEECFICKRDYGTVDDLDDLNEHVEYPVQLHPCKHIVGEFCMKQWVARNPTNHLCPYCRVQLTVGLEKEDSTVMKGLLTVCGTAWFQYHDRMGAIFTAVREEPLGQDSEHNDQTKRRSAMAKSLGWKAACSIFSSATSGALIALLIIFGVPVHLSSLVFFLLGVDPDPFYKTFLALVALDIVVFASVVHFVVGIAYSRSYLRLENE